MLPSANLREEVLLLVVVERRHAAAAAGPELREVEAAPARGFADALEPRPADFSQVAEQRVAQRRGLRAAVRRRVARGVAVAVVVPDERALEVEVEVVVVARPLREGPQRAGRDAAGPRGLVGAPGRVFTREAVQPLRRVVRGELVVGASPFGHVVDRPARVDEGPREAAAARDHHRRPRPQRREHARVVRDGHARDGTRGERRGIAERVALEGQAGLGLAREEAADGRVVVEERPPELQAGAGERRGMGAVALGDELLLEAPDALRAPGRRQSDLQRRGRRLRARRQEHDRQHVGHSRGLPSIECRLSSPIASYSPLPLVEPRLER